MPFHRNTTRATGKRKGRSEQHYTTTTRKSRRLLEKAMNALDITGENEAAGMVLLP